MSMHLTRPLAARTGLSPPSRLGAFSSAGLSGCRRSSYPALSSRASRCMAHLLTRSLLRRMPSALLVLLQLRVRGRHHPPSLPRGGARGASDPSVSRNARPLRPPHCCSRARPASAATPVTRISRGRLPKGDGNVIVRPAPARPPPLGSLNFAQCTTITRPRERSHSSQPSRSPGRPAAVRSP